MDESSSGWRNLSAIGRSSSVYLSLIFLLFLNAARIPFFDIGTITPHFLLMGIYFWLLTRPSILPPPAVFCCGLGLDLVSGQMVGLNAVCFMIVYFIMHGQRRYLKGQSWPVLWAGYGLASFIIEILNLGLFVLLNMKWPGVAPLIGTVAVSVLAYPVIVAPMSALNRIFSK